MNLRPPVRPIMSRLLSPRRGARSLTAAIPLLCAATLLGDAPPRSWTSLGDMPAGRPIPQGVEYRSRQGAVRITVAAPGVIRVRFSPTPRFGRDHSYAVSEDRPRATDARFTPGSDRDQLHTAGLSVEIRRTPFRLRFLDDGGQVRDEDYAPDGMASNGRRVRVWKAL